MRIRIDRHGDGKPPVFSPQESDIGPSRVAPARNGVEAKGSDSALTRALAHTGCTLRWCSLPRFDIEGRGQVPLGFRKESEATDMDRQPNPDPAQTKRIRLDGVILRVPDDPQLKSTLRPFAGRSVSSGTREP